MKQMPPHVVDTTLAEAGDAIRRARRLYMQYTPEPEADRARVAGPGPANVLASCLLAMEKMVNHIEVLQHTESLAKALAEQDLAVLVSVAGDGTGYNVEAARYEPETAKAEAIAWIGHGATVAKAVEQALSNSSPANIAACTQWQAP